jgi:8-oxo-dGTP pyrophosphatase MutT (NUDIX family)
VIDPDDTPCDALSFLPHRIAVIAQERLNRAPQAEAEDHGAEDLHNSDQAIAGMPLAAEAMTLAKPAAVLIPLIARPEGATVLLTQRTAALRQHSGQIAFPGGRIDEEDDGPLGAALREAEEEIGLAARHVSPLGFLGPYFSTTGYRITPVVALVEPDAPLRLNPEEVADVFETPLSFLMNPKNHLIHEREWKGAMRRFFAMPYGERYIWGVTAGILRMLWLKMYDPRRL